MIRERGQILGSVSLSIAILVILSAFLVLGQGMAGGQQAAKVSAAVTLRDATDSPIFLPPVTYDLGNLYPSAITVADLDRDGRSDLVVGSSWAVSLFRGKGDGTFQPIETRIVKGGWGGGIAVADLNEDGKLDLILVHDDGVAVLLGNGDGSFLTEAIYASGGKSPGDLVVADLNEDGKLDVVVANTIWNSTLGVLLGNGDGTLRSPLVYSSVGGYAHSVVVADVDRDGKPDVLLANWATTSSQDTNGLVGLLRGNGDGTLQPAVTFDSGGYYGLKIRAEDVNGDGNPDLQVLNLCQVSDDCLKGAVAILIGNGDGTFQSAVDYVPEGRTASSLAVSDVNGDGNVDLIVASCAQRAGSCPESSEQGVVSVLLGFGDGTFRAARAYEAGSSGSYSVAVADVNLDARPDLFVGHADVYGSMSVRLNNSGTPPTKTTLISDVNPAAPRQLVTYSASVTGEDREEMNGTVAFWDGSSTAGRVPLANNRAEFTTFYKWADPFRPHAILAVYSGDLRNAGSTSDVLTEDVGVFPIKSRTSTTSSAPTAFVGQSVIFAARVEVPASQFGMVPDGERITFYDGLTVLGSTPLVSQQAVFTTSSLTAQTHTIRATYSGDVLFKTSTGTLSQVIQKYPTATTRWSNVNPSGQGQAVTFTARVTSSGPTPPTGKVIFKDGTIGIGSAILTGGVAKLTKSALAVGTHRITAFYQGDGASSKSTSLALNQVVK